MSVPVTRSAVQLRPDPRRVITKPFIPGGVSLVDGRTRIESVLERILALSPADVVQALTSVQERFAGRHDDLEGILLGSYSSVARWIDHPDRLGPDLHRLIGAYFVHEFSLEAAALTNPSIVAAPDQSGLDNDSLRVVVSLRAIGEGHISSIEFRSGVLDAAGDITIDPARPPVNGFRQPPVFEKAAFSAKIAEIGAIDGLVGRALGPLGDQFTMRELDAALVEFVPGEPTIAEQRTIQTIHWVASSNYVLTFPPEGDVSQRVAFPQGPAESRGMEDARFVEFQERGRASRYYATYTAYDGVAILPQLIKTEDFVSFRFSTLTGDAARNKGMALFPRLIHGRYWALARADNESNFLASTDDLRVWQEGVRIQEPTRPWELFQLGNGGSPMETPAGWLVITHGVGPMRTYSLGAILLDLEDPTQVIGKLRDPFLVPNEDERDGYVPNVVYSCGALVHRDRLVIAYGASDTSTRFASVSVDDLVTELTRPGSAPAAS